ncbi:uncharacterized protein LOC126571437 isoform X2 [Anopheles aquasalis]|uniref:uncharacterized protein LOC126571437 isoform X2 n=1 Tax=Anopheles aquasalis TaxID=42839 RepID=UPI00215B53A0|nr:uncharacterized protein LOC126571437 isoform X2 [Anopheles aquasalis]
MANPPNLLREMVSGQRKRFIEDGYNLDLSYIGDRIIAMGYPADNVEAIYRNKRGDVVRFLKEKHSDCCKVYNLCSERAYDATLFQHYAEYPFKDHNPPDIELINKFCEDVDEFLRRDSRNVVAIHCKAGKGRTGTMICCYLLYSKTFQTANEALTFYAEKRTKDKKGVTIPSQRRYVEYYEQLLRGTGPYQDVTLYISEIRISPADVPLKSGTISMKGSKESYPLTEFHRSEEYVTVQLNYCAPLTGDVKIEFARSKLQDKRCHFWFNTFFVERAGKYDSQNRLVLSLTKKEIDDAHKGNTKKCPEQVVVFLQRVPINERRNGEKQHQAIRELSPQQQLQQQQAMVDGDYSIFASVSISAHHHNNSKPLPRPQLLAPNAVQPFHDLQMQQHHRTSGGGGGGNNRASLGNSQQNSGCIYGNIANPDGGVGGQHSVKPMAMSPGKLQSPVYAHQQQHDPASASSPTIKLGYGKAQSPSPVTVPAVKKASQKAAHQQQNNHSGGSSEENSGTNSVEEEDDEEDDEGDEDGEEEEGWESDPKAVASSAGSSATAHHQLSPSSRCTDFGDDREEESAGADADGSAMRLERKSDGVLKRTLKKVTHQLVGFMGKGRREDHPFAAPSCVVGSTLEGGCCNVQTKEDEEQLTLRSEHLKPSCTVRSVSMMHPLPASQLPKAYDRTTTIGVAGLDKGFSSMALMDEKNAFIGANGGQSRPKQPPLPTALDRSSSSGQLPSSHHDSSLGLMSSDGSLNTASSSATSSSRSIRDPIVAGRLLRHDDDHQKMPLRQPEHQPNLRGIFNLPQDVRCGPRTSSVDSSGLFSYADDVFGPPQKQMRPNAMIITEPGKLDKDGRGRQARATYAVDHLTDSGRSSTEINSNELETPSSSSSAKHSDDDHHGPTNERLP